MLKSKKTLLMITMKILISMKKQTLMIMLMSMIMIKMLMVIRKKVVCIMGSWPEPGGASYGF